MPSKSKQEIRTAKKQNIATRTKSGLCVFGFYIIYCLLLFFSNPTWFTPLHNLSAGTSDKVSFALNFINLLMLVPAIYFVAKEITNLCFPKNKGVFIYTLASIFVLTIGTGTLLLCFKWFGFWKATKLVNNAFTFYLIILASLIVLVTICSTLVWVIISKKYQYVAKKTKKWFTILSFMINAFFAGFFYITIVHQWTTFLFLLGISTLCDIFAYLGGTAFGKTKMAPNISPKKTWEGLGFGVAITLLIMCGFYALAYIPGAETEHHSLFIFLGSQCAPMRAGSGWTNLQGYMWAVYIFITLAIMTVSILGDLFFSYIKRRFEIKDFSNLIPGHGGILDRLDALIFTFVFYFVITITIQLITIALVHTNKISASHVDGLRFLWDGIVPNFAF